MKLAGYHRIVATVLGRAGFRPARVSYVEPCFSFTRMRGDQVYELIQCNFSGKRREAAVCRIGASVTRLIELKGLSESEVLLEVAEDRERGWTIVESSQKFRIWADHVARVAVEKASRFGDRVGSDLLRRTASIRRQAQRCIGKLIRMGSKEEAFERLTDESTETELQLAHCLSGWPGVMQVPQSELEYQLACLAVVKMLCNEKLPNPTEVSEMPLQNTQLMWQIQLIVDKLLDRDNENHLRQTYGSLC